MRNNIKEKVILKTKKFSPIRHKLIFDEKENHHVIESGGESCLAGTTYMHTSKTYKLYKARVSPGRWGDELFVIAARVAEEGFKEDAAESFYTLQEKLRLFPYCRQRKLLTINLNFIFI